MAELLTITEVARMLNLHEITVRRHIKQGKLKALKVGRRIRIRREDLDEFIKPVYPLESTLKTKPVLEPPSQRELERRKALVERILKRRAEMTPIGITAAELVKEGRKEGKARYVS